MTDAEFEILVGVLLSRLHLESQRIDGQGGDGGRDVELQIEGKLELFESKFFPDRVSKEKGRRKQVERSLARARPVSRIGGALSCRLIRHQES